MSRRSPLSLLQELTQDQWGLATRRQLSDVGIGTTTVERLASPGGQLERVARGVYQIAGAPAPDHRDLRAAWLQLAPEVPVWKRTSSQGVVSHRSAAALYELGHLPVDRHEFTVTHRRQSRRPDVRIHVAPVNDGDWATVRGMPTTWPPRIAADLLRDHEDPEAIAQVITEAIRDLKIHPGAFLGAVAPYASSFGFRQGDGLSTAGWLLDLAGDPERDKWLGLAREYEESAGSSNVPQERP